MSRYFWHPDVQNKKPNIIVKKAQGVFIENINGHRVIDGISSWWCKSLGHGHPRLKAVLHKQCERFEHVIQATTTNDVIEGLSELLCNLRKPLAKAFYAGDGACAVEIALKMSLHSRINTGQHKRTKFISLSNGYHGETCGALSVSDLGRYKNPYKSMLFDCENISGIPYVTSTADPLWNDCSPYWEAVERRLEHLADNLTAVILEPIVQGAGGMMIYSQDFLKKIRQWTAFHNIHLIADEIMTGLGRTGKLFACDHAEVVPDFMCLSKGLTSGWLPFSAVLTTNAIYEAFYDRTNPEECFLHSHTYSGNALGAALALETLRIIIDMLEGGELDKKCDSLQWAFQKVVDKSDILTNPRGIGMIAAADIKTEFYRAEIMDKFISAALESGALLRPIGKTIYWLPPLNIRENEIIQLKNSTLTGLSAALLRRAPVQRLNELPSLCLYN